MKWGNSSSNAKKVLRNGRPCREKKFHLSRDERTRKLVSWTRYWKSFSYVVVVVVALDLKVLLLLFTNVTCHLHTSFECVACSFL